MKDNIALSNSFPTQKWIIPTWKFLTSWSLFPSAAFHLGFCSIAQFAEGSELLSCVLSLSLPSRSFADACASPSESSGFLFLSHCALLVNVFSRQLVFDTVTKLYRSASACAHTVCFCSLCFSPLSRCMMSLSLLSHTYTLKSQRSLGSTTPVTSLSLACCI
jgi:hypothetical protein